MFWTLIELRLYEKQWCVLFQVMYSGLTSDLRTVNTWNTNFGTSVTSTMTGAYTHVCCFVLERCRSLRWTWMAHRRYEFSFTVSRIQSTRCSAEAPLRWAFYQARIIERIGAVFAAFLDFLCLSVVVFYYLRQEGYVLPGVCLVCLCLSVC